jgi:hypothetical protein
MNNKNTVYTCMHRIITTLGCPEMMNWIYITRRQHSKKIEEHLASANVEHFSEKRISYPLIQHFSYLNFPRSIFTRYPRNLSRIYLAQ